MNDKFVHFTDLEGAVYKKRLVPHAGDSHAEIVAALIVDQNGNPVSQSADREVVATRYTCKVAFTGAAVGDVIRQTVALDVSGSTMTVISVLWENESAGTTISAPPSVSANLEVIGGSSLTLAQLLSAGLATATNQVMQIGYAADLVDLTKYKLVNSEDLGAGVKYILKANGSRWQMIRKTYTDTSNVMAYASQTNNPSVTTEAAAWAARATLVYGSVSAA